MTSYVGVVADITDTIDKYGEQVQRIILCGPTDRSFEFDLLNYNVNLDSVRLIITQVCVISWIKAT